jgi:hypothetical protein
MVNCIKEGGEEMKLFAEEGLGRKFVGLVILFVLLLLGAKWLVDKVEMFESYAKWIVIGYGLFVGGNAGITISSILKKKNESGGKKDGVK